METGRVTVLANAMARELVTDASGKVTAVSYIDKATGAPLKRYPITDGTPLYRGTDGSLLKYYDGPTGNALFFGPVQATWKDGKAPWGAVRIFVNGVSRIVYIKNLTKAKEVAA